MISRGCINRAPDPQETFLDSKDCLDDLEMISDIQLSYRQVFQWDTKLSKIQGAEHVLTSY